MVSKKCLHFLSLYLFLNSPFFAESYRVKPWRYDDKMVIDHDGGADDAMAIFMALLYEEHFDGPKVIALTTVNGNVNETQAYINTQRILGVAGRGDVPIYRGSENALVVSNPTDEFFGLDGLGDNEDVNYKAIRSQPLHAALALIELSKKYRGQLVLVTLGTLTNIALAIRLDPGFLARLKTLYMGAGHIYDETHTLFAEPEFNVWLDVEAYSIVAQTANADKVTAIPFSQVITSFDTLTPDWRMNVLGAIPTKIMRALNEYERVSIVKEKMWQQLDPAVMAYALDNGIADVIKTTRNSVVLCGDKRGITLNDLGVAAGNMKILISADEAKFKQFLFKVFSADAYEVVVG